ncbi:MAG: hypothetical protein JKY27_11795 [Magnetovibrio sp.]|nr:hypothetical protein [Magnetovibrio sp.]
MSKLIVIRTIVLSFLSLGIWGAGTVLAGEASFSCPDLSAAEQVGSCPSDKELKEGYDATCPSAMARRNECKPFAAYAKSKGKSLWAAKAGDEEFLSYVQCGISPETVRGSKVQSVDVKCDFNSGRCEAVCGYENDFNLKLRIKGSCRTATAAKIDCKDDPSACTVTCETIE